MKIEEDPNPWGVNFWNKWNWLISVKSNIERGCLIGNHLFSQKRNAFLCNRIKFFLVSFPKHVYCSSRSLILDTPRFNWCAVQILSKMSGKLIVTVLYQFLLGYITQHFSWMYKIHAFRNVIPWNLVDTDVLEEPAVAFSGIRVTFLLKGGGIEFIPRLVHVCETTRRHIPEHSTLKSHHRAHLRSQLFRYCPLFAIYLMKGVYTIFPLFGATPISMWCDFTHRVHKFVYMCTWNQVFMMVVCNNKHKYY